MGDIIDQEACNTTLGLGISLDDFVPKRDHHQQQQQQKKKNRSKPAVFFDLSFPFPFPFKDEQEMEIGHNTEGSSSKTSMNGEEERQISVSNNNGNNNGGVRKKLRLTKEQSTLLEISFKQHSTPNMTQKQALADKLNLKPRQVEVWFQNRRARTKLKQTEVDCEFLKKCCENLRNENRRLKGEVQELRSSFKNIKKTSATTTLSKDSKPLFLQLRKANAATTMYSVCPSCQKMMIRLQGDATGGGTDDIVKG